MPDSQVQIVTAGLLEALGLLSITDADASQQSLVRRAINNGINEITTFAPANWYGDDETALVCHAPTATTLTVATNSKAFTSTDITTNIATMGGQAILIDGDSVANRIVRLVGSNELLIPFGGGVGTVGGIVYFDTLAMPANFHTMKGSLRVLGTGYAIGMTDSPVAMRSYERPVVGIPTMARLISRVDDNGFRAAYLQLDSLPQESMRIFFEYHSRAASITTLSDSRNDLVPSGYEDSVLLPICIKNLMSITSAIKIDQNAAMSNSANAIKMLVNLGDAAGYIGRTKMKSAFDLYT